MAEDIQSSLKGNALNTTEKIIKAMHLPQGEDINQNPVQMHYQQFVQEYADDAVMPHIVEEGQDEA